MPMQEQLQLNGCKTSNQYVSIYKKRTTSFLLDESRDKCNVLLVLCLDHP